MEMKKRGLVFNIAGTDCSGKETQSFRLVDALNGVPKGTKVKDEDAKAIRMSFPTYETPSGKIIAGPCLGKNTVCESWFEDFSTADPKASALYYAANRRYSKPKMMDIINSGKHLVLDRYISANMGHQGGKIFDEAERIKMYKWLEHLEFDMLELPRPDDVIFLHMPYEAACELKKERVGEAPDVHERNPEHLKNAEAAYLELADMYGWHTISCVEKGRILTKDEIHKKVYTRAKDIIDTRGKVLKKVK
jgi:dTMP kinase